SFHSRAACRLKLIRVAKHQAVLLLPLISQGALQKVRKDKLKHDFSRTLLIKFLSSLMKSENGVLDDSEEDPTVREESTRQLPSSQRERKAGCKNFFWKTFTSC
uniref:Somatostatin/Cortistatin C-terminal domain-containing protein n=1 Tax=Erpetoichthys calabaricus TaxID=27687 RepID=A0A8C4SEV4_ERPCA